MFTFLRLWFGWWRSFIVGGLRVCLLYFLKRYDGCNLFSCGFFNVFSMVCSKAASGLQAAKTKLGGYQWVTLSRAGLEEGVCFKL